VEAQTLANLYLAMEHDLAILPVINKIDLPGAEVEATRRQIDHDLGLDPDSALLVSAKMGTGVPELMEALVQRIPPPSGSGADPLRALIFDSHYDPYRGVIVHVRLFSGRLSPGQVVRFWSNESAYEVDEVGIFRLALVRTEALEAGEVGYLTAGIKTISDTRVGDTITDDRRPCSAALPGFREVKPVVFSSIYPVDSNDYEELADAMEKLKLNDASLVYEKDSSAALGFGFRCGFLGLLHLEIIQERLSREFDLDLIATAPSVVYRMNMTDGTTTELHNPADMPDIVRIASIEEPWIKATILTPDEYLGSILQLCQERRGIQTDLSYVGNRAMVTYELPLNEVVFDFYDRLKSISKGYASFDYTLAGYREGDLVKMSILVNEEPVDALSMLVHRAAAEKRGRLMCEKLKDLIPRHMFKIPIQAAIGGKVVARETISAMRKDVTAKCYGGDVSRKRKLLDKQKEGKKRMRQFGKVEIPQEAFIQVLKVGE
jgi:GTP-binding protein LepA